ncbi:arsenate reductase ArsC [Benzoatithermus flavus]|uniref:arsenate reductase ArsC n=1 Tax=Benzoatithermus flavus TaxID=3108223 RepID=UPI003AAC53FD
MTPDRVYNVLFLCTHNSARSIMAECILNREGRGRFRAFSAGSRPSGRINPFVRDLLERLGFDTADLRSKSWDELARPDAPKMDFVFTVCDSAAGEVCPVWPGQPITGHWSFPDPSSFEGSDAEKAAFTAGVFRMIQRRVGIFASLPIGSLDRTSLQRRLRDLDRPTAREATAAPPSSPQAAPPDLTPDSRDQIRPKDRR